MTLACIQFEPQFLDIHHQVNKIEDDLSALIWKLGNSKTHKFQDGFSCLYEIREKLTTFEIFTFQYKEKEYSFVVIPVYLENDIVLTMEDNIILDNLVNFNSLPLRNVKVLVVA